MTELRNCSTCVYWRAGAAAETVSFVHGVHGEVGACELYPPEIVIVEGHPTSIQPSTHGTRRCNEWKHSTWFDYPDDYPEPDEDPDPGPQPLDRDKVHRLFPNPPVKPVAA